MAMYLGEEEVGSIIELKDNTALKILDGTLEEFDNTKWGLSEIASFRFTDFLKLKKVDFTGLTKIPKNTCQGCVFLESIILPNNLTEIGGYSFQTAGFESEFEFELNQENCSISTYAFEQSRIKSLLGNYNNIGSYSFRLCNNLKEVDVTINGVIQQYAFANSSNIESFNIKKESVVDNLQSYVFQSIGINRENPETKIFNFDFSNSTFTTMGTYAFSGTTSTPIKYFNIKFPKTVTVVPSNALRYTDHMTLYFRSATPPTLNSNSFNYSTNLTICVPYNLVNAYKTATNWTTVTDSIRGFAEENTFKQGQKLPLYSSEGYVLTWYSDIDLTQQVTIADNPENFYYCTISAEAVEVVNLNTYVDNCSLSIVDTNGNSYETGYVPVGTQLTITVTPTTTGYVPYIQTFNNETFISPLSYTTITGTDIKINAIYYDGVNAPIGETFADTELAVIKKVIQDGQATQYWQVGDTKPLEVEGETYHVRLSDTQIGRYDYADGTRKSNAVLEFVELWNTSYRMNSTRTNIGGWAECEFKTTINTEILDKLPTELKLLLEEVVVASADGGANYTAITTSNNKLFIPCASEVGLSEAFGRVEEGTVWDYYINADASLRIKRKQNSTGALYWWLRSPSPNSNYNYSGVDDYGLGYHYNPTNTYTVSPCWAW